MLSTDRMLVQGQRRELVKSLFNEFAWSKIQHEFWGCLPSETTIQAHPYFSKYIETGNEALYSEPEARSILKTYLQDHIESSRRAFTVLILRSSRKSREYLGEAHTDEFVPLGLATSVFTCDSEEHVKTGYNRPVLVGWNDLGRHVNCTKESPTYDAIGSTRTLKCVEANEMGVHTLEGLLDLLGLDHLTTTVHELDGLDPRFLCTICTGEDGTAGTGRRALQWRECVSRVLQTHRDLFSRCLPSTMQIKHVDDMICSSDRSVRHTHYVPAWTCLSEEVLKSIRYHEDSQNLLQIAPFWSCKHCPAHFKSGVQIKEAKDHVTEEQAMFSFIIYFILILFCEQA